jgi:hypothetical protein
MREQLMSEVTPASTLPDDIMQEMFSLFSTYYSGVEWNNFCEDLLTKDWVILVREMQSKKVQGFTSLSILQHQDQNQPITIIYSGDTIIHQPYWNSRVLAKSWIKAVWDLTREKPQPLHWLLISSGFRTYRYLPVFFKQFFPCHNQSTPPNALNLMHNVANRLFADQFDPTTGIVRFKQGATPLKSKFKQAPEAKLQDPHIRFFVKTNSGHCDGDELVCLTKICSDNLTAAGKRMTR